MDDPRRAEPSGLSGPIRSVVVVTVVVIVVLAAWLVGRDQPIPTWIAHGPFLPVVGVLALIGIALPLLRRRRPKR